MMGVKNDWVERELGGEKKNITRGKKYRGKKGGIQLTGKGSGEIGMQSNVG